MHGPHVCLVKEDKVLKKGEKIEFSKKKSRKTFRSLRRKERQKEGKNACKVIGGKFNHVCAVSCVILHVTLCSLW